MSSAKILNQCFGLVQYVVVTKYLKDVGDDDGSWGSENDVRRSTIADICYGNEFRDIYVWILRQYVACSNGSNGFRLLETSNIFWLVASVCQGAVQCHHRANFLWRRFVLLIHCKKLHIGINDLHVLGLLLMLCSLHVTFDYYDIETYFVFF